MHSRKFFFFLVFLLFEFSSFSQVKEKVPHLLTWDEKALMEGRKKALAGDQTMKEAIDAVVKKADQLLKEPDLSVTQKSKEATELTGGDPHVYGSLSVYFWADSANPGGAWIRKDGKQNREWINKYDGPKMGKFQDRINTFTMAWWVTGNEKYAAAAAEQLKVWFINKDTYMYPQMDKAQFVPNHNEYGNGTCWGIIDANGFSGMLNSVGMLELSASWKKKDTEALKEWFRQFAKWLMESKNGKDEARQPNNHGVHYDVLLSASLLFTGDTITAAKVLNEVPLKRINTQIEPDGSMPRELAREGSFGYTCWNLVGWVNLASIADKINIDLWHYHSPDNRSIKAALDWVIPYLEGTKSWSWREKVEPAGLLDIFWRSSRIYTDQQMAFKNDLLEKVPVDRKNKNVFNIVFPQ